MPSDPPPTTRRRAIPRTLVAVALALLGAGGIWLIAPYNNHAIAAADITGSYLPAAALFLILLLVLVINPLLRLASPRIALDRRQLAVILAVLLVACVLPGFGLLDTIPYAISRVPTQVSQSRQLADIYQQMDLPPSMFPDGIAFGQATPNSENFLSELPRDAEMPWRAWVGPLLTWGGLLIFAWLMMVGLSMIVFPQWRRNERLAFPLLAIQQEIIADPQPGRLLPPLLTKRGFWVAAIAVLAIHTMVGLSKYCPESVPAIPLDWDMSRFFVEGMWRHMPWPIVANRIYFIFIGIAFFLPNRVSVSVWFFALAYAAYQVLGAEFFPPAHSVSKSIDHRLGAAIGLTLAILWIGRHRWAEVFRALLRRAATDADRRDRTSAAMFLAGCAGMWAWLVWIGVGVVWAAGLVAFGFMVSILIARIVAETGIPFIRIHLGKEITLIKLLPIPWIGPLVVFFGWIWILLFNIGSRVSLAAMATQAVGLDEDASPRGQVRLGWLLMATMVIGLVVCGAAHLWTGYHHSTSLGGQQFNSFGVTSLDASQKDLADWSHGQFSHPPYNQVFHIIFGAVLAMVLQGLCLISPQWPIHPIGLLMVNSTYGKEAWASIFVGWFLKVLIVRLGGSRLYSRARPFFFGLIAGEIFAVIVWAIVPAVLSLQGIPYEPVKITP